MVLGERRGAPNGASLAPSVRILAARENPWTTSIDEDTDTLFPRAIPVFPPVLQTLSPTFPQKTTRTSE
jgi:hypothetical protein